MRIFYPIIVLGLVLSLALFGVIALLDAVVDPTDNTDPEIVRRDLSGEEAGFIQLVRALSSTDENGVAHLKLDAYDVNELLYSFRTKLSFGPLRARSIYIEENGGGYRICLPVSLYGFDTMLSGDLELYDENGKDLCAGIRGLKIGKASIDSGLLSSLNIKGAIVGALNGQGITAFFEGESLTVRLTRENMGDILADSIKNDPNADLWQAMYSLLMINTNAVVFDVSSPADIDITIDLGFFGGKAEDSLTGVNAFTTDLLSRGVIGRDKVNLAAKYYINGYGRLSNEEKAVIDSLALGDPNTVSSHAGLIERESLSLVSLLLTQLELNTNLFAPGFKIADRDVNALLSDHELVGTVWQFVNSRDNSCAFVAIREVYTTISDDLINIHIDFDINGYIMTISVDVHTGESPLAAVTGSLGDVYIGETQLGDGEVSLIFDFLCTQLKDGWITADKETRSVTLDFTSAFEENQLLRALLSSPNIITVCEKSLLTDGGFVQITFKLL